MPGLKRKVSPVAQVSAKNAPKRGRTSGARLQKPDSPRLPAEAVTDSDPIVESDTTERSGNDDGVSWPSDSEDDRIMALPPKQLQGSGKRIQADKRKGVMKPGVQSTSASGRNDNEVVAADHATYGSSMEEKSQILPAFIGRGPDVSSSREAHVKQKCLAQERKATKPNADLIARSKKLWERLRRKSHVPIEERRGLIAELFEIITGRVKEFVFKHDSVRVVQTALKYANLNQRMMIASELKGEYRTLAESRYAKFLIGKLLVEGGPEVRNMIVPEFYGAVRRMIKHPEASWILDDAYRAVATSEQKEIMLREWYGAEFAIFKIDRQEKPSSNLKEILLQQPHKRAPIMKSLHELINQMVQKKTTGFTMLHDAMLQYFLNVQPAGEEATEFIELLQGDEEGDLLKNLAFTKSGARLVCLALAHGNAKDRKKILKTYKGTVQALAYDVYGHKVLLAAYDVIDDTVLTSKSIFPELLNKDSSHEQQQDTLMTYVDNIHARIPLLYLFAGRSKSILAQEDLTLLDEIHCIRTTTSKKEPESRRKELVDALSPPLLDLIASRAKDLGQTSFGCQFMADVLLGAGGNLDIALSQNKALRAVAEIASPNSGVRDILETPAVGRMLKILVLGGRFDTTTKSVKVVEPPLRFHDILYPSLQDHVIRWATGPNSFVIVGFLEAEGFSHRSSLLSILRENREKLAKAAVEEANIDKALNLPTKKKRNKNRARGRGNVGTRRILELLDIRVDD